MKKKYGCSVDVTVTNYKKFENVGKKLRFYKWKNNKEKKIKSLINY